MFVMASEIPYQNFPSYVLRTPLFPFTFLDQLIAKTATPEKQLKEVCASPEIQEAIFLASPNLYDKMMKWLEDTLDDPKEEKRLPRSIMRYILRMCTRCTPFGLFAGFTLGHWQETSNVTLPPREEYKRHTRLDMNYLCALALDLAKDSAIKEKIRYYPNSSIYELGDQLRYVEYRYHNSRRTHHIVAVDQSPYLKTILTAARKGCYLRELAEMLVDEEITIEESREFIEELIDSQLLVHDLEPAITGPEFLNQILEVLEPIEEANTIKSVIQKTRKALRRVDNSKIGSTTSLYKDIASSLKGLGTDYELKFLFQTDMVKPPHVCQLSREIVNQVLLGIAMMNRFSPGGAATHLTRFRDSFFERYEEAEVPLLQALDTESGIGYKEGAGVGGDLSPLVDDLSLPGTGIADRQLPWNPIQSFLFKKYREATSKNLPEVSITDEEVKSFSPHWDDLPDTLSTMVHLLNDPQTGGVKIVMSSAGGSSAANLLGRFCHADEETHKFVKTVTQKEKEVNPDIIFAEIIHLSEARVGNILLRPILRDHEIPYLAKAAVGEDYQIKVEDLMLSVKRGQLVLRSKRLEKIIVPRLSTAHNFSFNALPIYQFLCDMQTQDKRGGVGFSWGVLANEYPFLPRVTYKNIILSLARWNITGDEIKALLKIKEDEHLFKEFRQWCEQRKIPEKVCLADGDNELFINTTNFLCIQTLLSLIKNRSGFELVEFPFQPEDALVKSPEGLFSNEFILSFYKTKNGAADKENG